MTARCFWCGGRVHAKGCTRPVKARAILIWQGRRRASVLRAAVARMNSIHKGGKDCGHQTMKKYRYWTTGELRRLRELRLSGVTVHGIAEAMGRSIPSVKGQLQHIEFSLAATRREQWLKALRRRQDDVAVAAEMGVGASSVRSTRTRMNQKGFDL